MPTILQVDGFQGVIYFNDHEPAHVHVFKADGEMRVKIDDASRAPIPIEIVNLKNNDVRRGLAIVGLPIGNC
ncbi:DUF4160 domain-containing protein [Gloeobacter morelensis]|uniref:DUF4160 domain-containing protein n=1 Tax=Gloeobacter morelensis MG652769 TaxID=2781736 RepID=A0ABY3PIV4_9CYAN|nr:DUF4160 domain-containing protein [Gloeobacter morelensis]UFP93544.1 DUF4160 domain-containing protein [Gloeobacter morelensis MG652769]